MALINQEALKERAKNLEGHSLNGLKFVLVTLYPKSGPTEAHLEVHFYNTNKIADILADTHDPKLIFPISGGHRIPAGPASDMVRVTQISGDPAGTVLNLVAKPIGDYSTYTLRIEYENIDPIFSEINFKFRPECFSIDCAPDWERAPEPKVEPVIDYLAKDYDSFKHTLIAAMKERVPGWQPSSEASLDMVLMGLFSAAADELSDFQDRVMNEAYLLTARKRVSLARHGRLMDYHIHQGNQASTWLSLQVHGSNGFSLPGAFTVWAGDDKIAPSSSVFLSTDQSLLLFSIGLDFQNDLDSVNFTNNLRNRFESSGILLSLNVSVSVKESGKEWEVRDNDSQNIYIVRKEEKQLKVYAPCILHPLLNSMKLYKWSGSIPALVAGSTRADLKITDAGDEVSAKKVQDLIRNGNITHLLVQEWLNPVTGQNQGRDQTKRQVLKLLPSNDGATAVRDPMTGEWFVRVQWEDMLKSNYCFTVNCPLPQGKIEGISFFHGNLLKVHHGRPKNIIFKEPGTPLAGSDEFYFERQKLRGRRLHTLCRLPEEPLAYRDTPPGGEHPPESTLRVEVVTPGGGSEEWYERISLIHSTEVDEHFVVETDENEQSLIRFGDGVNGKDLPDGARVQCYYQTGRGTDGNIGADSLVNFDTASFPEIDECWNPLNITSGRAPEPAEEFLRCVPEAYRSRQLRAVTLQDYVNRAKELPAVSNAMARYAWTGSWRTVQITIDPVGTQTLDEKLRKEIERYLDTVRLIGEDLEIRPPRFVPLEIHVFLCVCPDYWTEDIRFLLEQEFSDGFTRSGEKAFFHPDEWTFGQPLITSQILGRVQSIEGVDHVISVSMKRWNEATPGTDGVIELRHNEIIQVRNDPDHMEKGFMDFTIKGGRQ